VTRYVEMSNCYLCDQGR